MLSQILDYLFPKKSLGNREGEWVTPEERAQLRAFPIILERAALQREGIAHLDRLVAGSTYAGNPLLKKAVWTMKFRRVPALSRDLGSMLLAGAMHVDAQDAVLVPVPLHWSRRFHRGFNQAELLANVVSEARHIPVVRALKRVRATGYQSHRSRNERRTALLGAFRSCVRVPPRIVLIDDIATTGATLDACAAVLKEAGAQWVEGWVVARG